MDAGVVSHLICCVALGQRKNWQKPDDILPEQQETQQSRCDGENYLLLQSDNSTSSSRSRGKADVVL